jgi:hypothetical protein
MRLIKKIQEIPSEEITKEDFFAYESVRVAGVTNMFDLQTVQDWSDLSFDMIVSIQKNYSELSRKFEGGSK